MPKHIFHNVLERLIGVCLGTYLLTACGYTSLYGDGFGDSEAMFASVEVSPIPERLGQLMRARLIERLGDTNNARYRLDITLDTGYFQFGLRGDDPNTGAIGDAAATQERVTLTATYDLIDQTTGEVIRESDVVVRSSFDLVLSDFAIVAQREDTTRRLTLQAVEKIERELALFFRKNTLSSDGKSRDVQESEKPEIEQVSSLEDSLL